MEDFSKIGNYKNLVMNFTKQIIEDKKPWFPEGLNCINRETFFKDNPQADKSIFATLDFDNDGYITESEYEQVMIADENRDGKFSENELKQHRNGAVEEALFSARRNIDKWFTMDVNRDGLMSNVEEQMAKYRMRDYTGVDHIKDSALSNEQLAEKYNMAEEKDIGYTLEDHIQAWQAEIINNTKWQFGIELSRKEIVLIQKEMMKQLNTWLFKTGDNATGNAPLYNSMNTTSYTRLVTDEQTISCCGGDIVPPPMTENKDSCAMIFSPIKQEGQGNSSDEMKNRLAWAMFPVIPEEELAQNPQNTVWENMTDEQYNKYHTQYMAMRNMQASDFRELLKPENKTDRENFEENSIMTVGQIVQYIDIVEQVTGKPWDSDGWSVDCKDFHIILEHVNGTQDDEKLLQDKTRADVPQNRQELLRFLEEKGWLYEQFK